MREPTVADVMNPHIATLAPETPFKHVIGIMIARDQAALPVIDAAGRPVGVVAEADVLPKLEFHAGIVHPPPAGGSRARARWHKAAALTAADLMTTPTIMVTADTPLSTAVYALSARQIRQVCVVDANELLIGMLARQDTLRPFLRPDDTIRAEVERELATAIPHSSGVTVDVTNGIVTLGGARAPGSAVHHAISAAHHVPGVVAVRNKMGHDADDLLSASAPETEESP
ncbi:CBS domain-containing protein [Amycolatopsis sp. NPDC059657]|uniref:CBS domain-containing protein n=1 Tax=Amycolatopsis sp. NPDC059657 TaxID=3346899 RepID=UPI00366E1EB4